jgi:hypothetical protein
LLAYIFVRHPDAAGNADGVGLAAIDHHGIRPIGHFNALRRSVSPPGCDTVSPDVRVEIDMSIPGDNFIVP